METEDSTLSMSVNGEVSGSWICMQEEPNLISVRKTKVKVDWIMQPQRVASYVLIFTGKGWMLQPVSPVAQCRRTKR